MAVQGVMALGAPGGAMAVPRSARDREVAVPLLVSPRPAEVEDSRRDDLVEEEEAHRAIRRGQEEVPRMDQVETHAGHGDLAGAQEDRPEDRRIGRQGGRRVTQVDRGAPMVDRRTGRMVVSEVSPMGCMTCCGRWSMCNGSWQSLSRSVRTEIC